MGASVCVCVTGCMHGWMDGWIEVCMRACVCAWKDGRTDVCMYVCMDGWVGGCMDRCMDACMYIWVDECMDGCMDAGNDLRNVSATSKAILLNELAISVNQDPRGEMGIRVTGNVPLQVRVSVGESERVSVCE